MVVEVLVKRGTYQDSVRLMQISKRLNEAPGVERASVMMGTPQNKEVLRDSGLYNDAVAKAEPSDMLIAVMAETDEAAKAALALAEETGATRVSKEGDSCAAEPGCRTIEEGCKVLDGADLAVISVPGTYAAGEALKALKAGLNVFLFSDNVSLDDEVRLKRLAHKRGCLLMGPDCGTALVGGVPLGFANGVREGNIGIVGASGTGMQEVMSLIHRHGCGISQAFGTGGRDVSQEVGGITMLDAMDILGEDPDTEIIVCVSKPPAATVTEKVLSRLAEIGKTAVVCFLGSQLETEHKDVHVATTLQETAKLAVGLAKHEWGLEPIRPLCACGSRKPDGGDARFVRGLFSGGSLAEEAFIVLKCLGEVHANLAGGLPIEDLNTSVGHTVLDMGTDEFTVGRPHPMIDYSYRIDRFRTECADPSVGVILMDVVLGFGSHPDPASALAPVIKKALADARHEGRKLSVVLSVVGTDLDPQGYYSQIGRLKEAGAVVGSTNVEAARLAVDLAVTENGKAGGKRGGYGC